LPSKSSPQSAQLQRLNWGRAAQSGSTRTWPPWSEAWASGICWSFTASMAGFKISESGEFSEGPLERLGSPRPRGRRAVGAHGGWLLAHASLGLELSAHGLLDLGGQGGRRRMGRWGALGRGGGHGPGHLGRRLGGAAHDVGHGRAVLHRAQERRASLGQGRLEGVGEPIHGILGGRVDGFEQRLGLSGHGPGSRRLGRGGRGGRGFQPGLGQPWVAGGASRPSMPRQAWASSWLAWSVWPMRARSPTQTNPMGGSSADLAGGCWASSLRTMRTAPSDCEFEVR